MTSAARRALVAGAAATVLTGGWPAAALAGTARPAPIGTAQPDGAQAARAAAGRAAAGRAAARRVVAGRAAGQVVAGRAVAGRAVAGRAAGQAVAGRAVAGQRPRYCGHGGSRLWANLAACGWPGPATTGPDLRRCPGHRLVPRGSSRFRAILIRKGGTVISCQKITGLLHIEARNVVIRNSTVIANSGKKGAADNGTADIKVEDGASATVDHVTANGDNGVDACIWHQGTRLKVTALNCHNVRDGIYSWADPGFSDTTGNNFSITGSYFHNFTRMVDGHEDGYQTEGASHGRIAHNTYQLTINTGSAIAIWDGRRPASDITVTGNLITGGGFAIYAEDYSPGSGATGQPSAAGGFSVSRVRFLGNLFSTRASRCVGRWGVWFTRPGWRPYRAGPTGGWQRQGNRVLETGERIDAHNPHRGGALCG
jgi:hypothetical protein